MCGAKPASGGVCKCLNVTYSAGQRSTQLERGQTFAEPVVMAEGLLPLYRLASGRGSGAACLHRMKPLLARIAPLSSFCKVSSCHVLLKVFNVPPHVRQVTRLQKLKPRALATGSK